MEMYKLVHNNYSLNQLCALEIANDELNLTLKVCYQQIACYDIGYVNELACMEHISYILYKFTQYYCN